MSTAVMIIPATSSERQSGFLMRIFIGSQNIANCAQNLQKGFQELGHDAYVGLEETNRYYSSFAGDIALNSIRAAVRFQRQPNGTTKVVPSPAFTTFVDSFDLFVFIASSSLLPRLVDLPLLSSMGKTIVAYQTGSEVRDPALSKLFWTAYGHSYPFSYEKKPLYRHFFDLPLYLKSFNNLLYNTRMAEAFATAICSSPAMSTLAVRPYMSLQFPFTADGCRWRIPENDTLKVVHAPTSRKAKGTKTFFRIFQELKDEGVKFDLQLLENRPHHEVLAVLSDADVLVDQLACDCLGGLSFEGLASGCAVASGNCGSVPWPPDRPALSITPKTAKERIHRMLTDAPFRRSYAERGKDWVDYYQSPAVAAQAILDALDREKTGRFDYYPVLFMQKAQYIPKAPTPEFLQQMTVDILLRHGLHPDADIQRLILSKAISPATVKSLKAASRWAPDAMHKVGPWNWCGKHIPPPSFDPDMADWLEEDEASRLADPCRENTKGILGGMGRVRDSIRYCWDWYYRRKLKRAYAKRADVKAGACPNT
ncbi:hypothetical protein LJB82_03870 [Desulfovibrio sp. OttesenSCG-928-M16]|nr:hypothetical protein [Desulfovibrio sp. OttesenSCG-928-M16]